MNLSDFVSRFRILVPSVAARSGQSRICMHADLCFVRVIFVNPDQFAAAGFVNNSDLCRQLLEGLRVGVMK
jgi:hypothetical protein